MASFLDYFLIRPEKPSRPRPTLGPFPLLHGNLLPAPHVVGEDLHNLIKEGYLRNATVYSIIRAKANAAASVPWLLYKAEDKKALRRALHLKQRLAQGIEGRPALHVPASSLLTKSAEIESHPVLDMVQDADWTQHTQETISYLSLCGNAYERGYSPESGPDAGKVTRIESLPAPIVVILEGGSLRIGNMGDTIPADQVQHLKYWRPQLDAAKPTPYGLSPLSAARYLIQQSNDNANSMLSMLQNGGAMGIVSSKSSDATGEPSFNQEQAEALRLRWDEVYSGAGNRGKVAFSPAALEFLKMGLSAVDMAIIESETMTDRKLCNVFGFPSLLLGDSTQKTFANYKEAKKSLYTECVLPDLQKVREARNKLVLGGRKDENLYFELDVMAVPELREDVREMVAAYKDAYWLTNNEKRALMLYAETTSEGDNRTHLPNSYADTDMGDIE